MASDIELLDRWREGDRKAGAALFDRHFVALARFFANKVGDAADDLIQQTLLACVESRDKFRGDSSFRTFLFSVAHNVLRNHFRSRRRDRLDLDFGITSMAELAPGPTTVVAVRARHRVLLEALRRIPVDHQVLLELYYWERLHAADVAAILDVPEGTVRTRIRRAKELLTQELDVARTRARLDGPTPDLDAWATEVRNEVFGRPTPASGDSRAGS